MLHAGTTTIERLSEHIAGKQITGEAEYSEII